MIFPARIWLGCLAGALALAASLHAQSERIAEVKPADVKEASSDASAKPSPFRDEQVVPTSGCCGKSWLGGASLFGSGYGGGCFGDDGGLCVPGRTGCTPGGSHSIFGRLLNAALGEVCCPDPCYEPRWIPAANAAFFQDSPRPVTQTRIRWDSAHNHTFPDSAEFFWARIGQKGPQNPTPGVRYNDLTYFQEIATPGASAWVEMSYRTIDSTTNPSTAGLGDVNIGAKTVLLDRELILVSMQIRTQVPAGSFTKGLGTGHVALEPSLLSALKLTESTYLQTQLAYWIPLGGTPGFAGSTFHYHFSLNQDLYRHGDFFSVLATMEVNGYSFRGRFTDFVTQETRGLAGRGYINLGPGLRLAFCDRADIGVAAVFGLSNHGPENLYRTELRFRF